MELLGATRAQTSGLARCHGAAGELQNGSADASGSHQRPQADVSNPTRQRAFELSFWRQAIKGMTLLAATRSAGNPPRAVLFAGPLVITADSPSLKVDAFPAHAYRLYPATAHSTHLRSIRWRASRGSQRGAPHPHPTCFVEKGNLSGENNRPPNNTLNTQSCAQQTHSQSRTLGAHPRRADPPSVRDRFAGRRPQHTLCTAKRNKDRGGLITPPFPQASRRCAIRGWRLHTQPVMVRPRSLASAHTTHKLDV